MGQERTFFHMFSKETCQKLASFPNQQKDKRKGLREHILTCNMCLLPILNEAVRKHAAFQLTNIIQDGIYILWDIFFSLSYLKTRKSSVCKYSSFDSKTAPKFFYIPPFETRWFKHRLETIFVICELRSQLGKYVQQVTVTLPQQPLVILDSYHLGHLRK